MSNPKADVIGANQKLAEMDEAVQDNYSRRELLEVMRIKPLMEARKDKRRPPEVSAKGLLSSIAN